MWCINYRSCNSSAKRSMIKNIALIICVYFIVTFFLSAAFVLTHANHEHDHEGPNGTCATCIHLAAVENSLKQLSTAIVASVLAFVLCISISFCFNLSAPYVVLFTLVTLKVRLNNWKISERECCVH